MAMGTCLMVTLSAFVTIVAGVPSPSPTYIQCIRAGGCIPLNNATDLFCCSERCVFVASDTCGYECLSEDNDDDLLNHNSHCISKQARPTPLPSTFPPTNSICLRGGECMIPNTTCCSGRCHRAKTSCLYGYSCNHHHNMNDDSDDIYRSVSETDDYCRENLKPLYIDDDNADENESEMFEEIGIYGFVAIIFLCIPCTYLWKRASRLSSFDRLPLENDPDVSADGYVLMGGEEDNSIPFAQSEPIILQSDYDEGVLSSSSSSSSSVMQNVLVASSVALDSEDAEAMSELPRASVTEVVATRISTV